MKAILLVEDEPWLAEAYVRSLQRAGYQAVTVRQAQAAIESIDEHMPSAIILDLLLPGANGLQLLHELRSYADLQHIPVILCSSQRLALDQAQLQAYGVARVLQKAHLSPQKLVQSIEEVLAA